MYEFNQDLLAVFSRQDESFFRVDSRRTADLALENIQARNKHILHPLASAQNDPVKDVLRKAQIPARRTK